ncbi:MAG TPA: 23S rRNA (guanosine(2251)-2'-O)-methyltransferase RlmB [Desulfotomaculum sp.]|nr:23S rRNA (guanosine(2251)-2'-O)-methyltransferase RlmB [Desulfotomaculum sp.]
MTEILYGRHPIREALRSGRPLNKILIARGLGGPVFREIRGLAAARGIRLQLVDRRALDRIASGGVHQGYLAFAAVKEYVTVDDILVGAEEPPLLVVLAHITDPRNLGAILRTAAAAGVDGVIIPSRRAAGLSGEVAKAAAGAVEQVPVARVTNIARTLRCLKERGFWIVGAEAGAPAVLWEVRLTGAIAVVIGGETAGLGRTIQKECDYKVRIPMSGKIASLNASVAAAVVLYEVFRQRYRADAGNNNR